MSGEPEGLLLNVVKSFTLEVNWSILCAAASGLQVKFMRVFVETLFVNPSIPGRSDRHSAWQVFKLATDRRNTHGECAQSLTIIAQRGTEPLPPFSRFNGLSHLHKPVSQIAECHGLMSRCCDTYS